MAQSSGKRINWLNVLTVGSAAILIAAEVFGAAFAGGWAIANYFQLGEVFIRIFQVFFFLCGIVVMAYFLKSAKTIEPFTERR